MRKHTIIIIQIQDTETSLTIHKMLNKDNKKNNNTDNINKIDNKLNLHMNKLQSKHKLLKIQIINQLEIFVFLLLYFWWHF